MSASDASGVVVKVGGSAAAKLWQAGDRVFSLMRPSHLTGPSRAEHMASTIGIPKPGVLTEYRVFPAAGLLAVPEYMTHDEACTLPVAATTAWMALNWDQPIGQPRSGQHTTVLLQGTGGVSIAALQQSTALGLTSKYCYCRRFVLLCAELCTDTYLTAIITSSSDAKLQQAHELGADHVINYRRTPDWATEVLRLTNGRGADIIVKTGGPATMDQSLRAVAEGGTISAIGVLTGVIDDKPGTAIGLSLISRNAAIKGINVGPRDRTEEMLRQYASERVRPVIDRAFDFTDAKAAFNYMKEGSHFGKIVVKVSDS